MRTAVGAGDTSHAILETVALTPSSSRVDRGTVRMRYGVMNRRGEDMTTFTRINVGNTRAARAG